MQNFRNTTINNNGNQNKTILKNTGNTKTTIKIGNIVIIIGIILIITFIFFNFLNPSSPEDLIVGTWKNEYGGVLIFDKNGTYHSNVAISFPYYFEDDTLYLGGLPYKYELTKNELVTYYMGQLDNKYHRVK